MNKEFESELNSILQLYRDRQKGNEDSSIKREQEGNEFIAKFEKLRQEVIRPALTDFVNKLNLDGQKSEISESTDPPTIKINVAPEGRQSTFSFSAVRERTKIIAYAGNLPLNHQWDSQEFLPDEITHELVQRNVIEFLKRVFI